MSPQKNFRERERTLPLGPLPAKLARKACFAPDGRGVCPVCLEEVEGDMSASFHAVDGGGKYAEVHPICTFCRTLWYRNGRSKCPTCNQVPEKVESVGPPARKRARR